METLQQHLQTYLNQKYGLKAICVEQAKIIISAVQHYAGECVDARLFGKILRNQINEGYWTTHTQVKATLEALYKAYLRERGWPRGLTESDVLCD